MQPVTTPAGAGPRDAPGFDVLPEPPPEPYGSSVWIAAGPARDPAERALALKSTSSLAVTGCRRDGADDCPED